MFLSLYLLKFEHDDHSKREGEERYTIAGIGDHLDVLNMYLKGNSVNPGYSEHHQT